MYKDEVKDLEKQKREAKCYLLLDFIKIYLKFKICFPHLEEERKKLVEIVQLYFHADKNESEALKLIEACYGNRENDEEVNELLDHFDDMFVNLYQYCQTIFQDYESFMEDYGNFLYLVSSRISSYASGEVYELGKDMRYRLKTLPISFPTFHDSYKEKVMKRIPNLPKLEEVEL